MPVIDKIQKIIENWKRANPGACHFLGIHEYDGELPSYREKNVNKRINEMKSDLKTLNSLKPEFYSKFDRFELNLVILNLERELFELDERKEFKESPMPYIFPLSAVEGSFTARSFASVEDRVKLIIKYEQNLVPYIEESYDVFNDSMAQIKVYLGLQFLEGFIKYYKGESLRKFVESANNETLTKQWGEANDQLLLTLEKYFIALKTKYLPKAHENFRLGKEKYLRLLQKQEFVNLSYEKLLQAGEEDLQRNYDALMKILSEKEENYLNKLKHDYPPVTELISYAASTLDRTKNFCEKVVTIPTNVQCKVIETPEFLRKFAFAAMNPPGPFEVPEADEAYYYVTPPDNTWDEQTTKAYMTFFNKANLEGITIHEAWPGHYLQLLYNKKSKSDISKMFAHSTSMIEGWGHYVEEMVIDEGYAPFNQTDLRIGQLLLALPRNCRYIASVKMHCEDMSIEEAKQLFMEKGFLNEQSALIEARRGTIDPMYLNYTLGKLMIKKLRSDFQTIKGYSFLLKEFHDTLLSYGSPPITVLRELLLEDSKLISQII